jgi:ribulose-bisphosphate carboxylase small chain
MRITQGCFSFLPDLTDDQIRAQVQYCIDKGFAVNIEFTDDPHPRNTFWEMWDLPMFDIKDTGAVMLELAACRKAHAGRSYIRISGFDSGRTMRYTTEAYSAGRPEGERY